MIDKIKAYVKTLENEVIPQLSVNCVIFGFHEKSLKMIVNKIDLEAGSPLVVLPGGYVGQKEDLSAAVIRIVRESTGLENILFRQFDVFGKASRSFGKELASHPKLTDGDRSLFNWVAKRHITICYMALVDFNKIVLKPTQFLESAEWLSIENAANLAMDHADIARSARESLLRELPYSPVESNLLPKKFTLPELHSLMEAILGRHIDRPNFRRKALKSNALIKVGQDGSQGRRPADLYTFKHGKKTSLNEEYRFGF